jgi:hypothetical protein
MLALNILNVDRPAHRHASADRGYLDGRNPYRGMLICRASRRPSMMWRHGSRGATLATLLWSNRP